MATSTAKEPAPPGCADLSRKAILRPVRGRYSRQANGRRRRRGLPSTRTPSNLECESADIQHCVHILAAIVVCLVAPFAGIAEGHFGFLRSIAENVAAAAASRILMIWRKRQGTGIGERLYQEVCLCIAACEAVRKNDQRISVGWRGCGGFPNGNITAGDSYVLRPDALCKRKTNTPEIA